MTEPIERGERAFLDPDSFRFLFQVERRMSIVRTLAGWAGAGSVIDLGCGDGRISTQFLTTKSTLTLVDTSPTMLERAGRAVPDPFRDRVRLIQDSIVGLDETDQYDLVLAIGVLAHVGDLPGTLAKVAALVAPTGRAILQLTDAATVPGAAANLWSQLTATRRGYRHNRLTERQVVTAMARQGMELLDRACYSAIYRRTSRRPAGTAPPWLRGWAHWAVGPFGAEKFLVFRPAAAQGSN